MDYVNAFPSTCHAPRGACRELLSDCVFTPTYLRRPRAVGDSSRMFRITQSADNRGVNDPCLTLCACTCKTSVHALANATEMGLMPLSERQRCRGAFWRI